MGYLLSIVVPTKDRYFYLKHLIELIKSFNSDDIELIIQDNTAENTDILNFLSTLNYPHLKYFHTKEQISVSENSTKAILNSSGEYICFIGDDDGVTRHIVDCVKWMKNNAVDIVRSGHVIYKWPSFPNGRLKLSSTIASDCFSGDYQTTETETTLIKMLRTGITGLHSMPKVYNGIVKRSLLNEIYDKTGTFFPGSSPDMGNAVALCFVADKYTYFDFPIIIGGICGSGGGNIMKEKRGYKELSEAPFLPKGIEDRWYSGLPKVWTNETIWPQSAIEGLKSMGGDRYMKYIDDSLLQANIIVSHPNLKDKTLALSNKKLKVLSLVLKLKLLRKFRNAVHLALYYLCDRFNGKMKIYRNLDTIEEAEALISKLYPTFPFN